MDKYLPQLNNLFSQYKEIKLVYLFGSQAKKKISPLSDYDFAVYFDQNIDVDCQKELILTLISGISLIIRTEKIDLVVLNQSFSPLFKFNILKEGNLIYQQPPYKLIVEPAIYSEYFDFKIFTQNYNL